MNTQLFRGISEEGVSRLLACFKPEINRYRRGDTILVLREDADIIGILLSGSAHLYCVDSSGEASMIAQYGTDDIFGEIFVSPCSNLGYVAEADSDCEVMFIRLSLIYSPCGCGCELHSVLMRNMFEMTVRKTRALSMRMNFISRKSMRRKLEEYLQYMSELAGDSFELDMSLSQLASYLCIDRSSMMRELKSMAEEGLIERSGRKIKIRRLGV